METRNAHNRCPADSLPTEIEALSGKLSSTNPANPDCSPVPRSWLISASPGQRINISLMDFSVKKQQQPRTGSGTACVPYGFLLEPRLGVNKTLCGGVAREWEVYTTASSSLQIVLLPVGEEQAAFLVDFQG